MDIVNESSDIMDIAQRIGPIVGGLFFFCFGLPFTLVPFMMFIDGEFDLGDPGFTVFMIAFSLPFLFAGLTLNFMGLGMIDGPSWHPRIPPSPQDSERSDPRE